VFVKFAAHLFIFFWFSVSLLKRCSVCAQKTGRKRRALPTKSVVKPKKMRLAAESAEELCTIEDSGNYKPQLALNSEQETGSNNTDTMKMTKRTSRHCLRWTQVF